MRRAITGFHLDDEGHHVAELSCLHGQHVRHQPPWQERPWVLTAEGRTSRIGMELECPACDRAEPPDGLRVARTAGPFDDDTLPPGLRRTHRVAAGTWGRLRVLAGVVDFTLAVSPPIERRLGAGDEQAIPPEVDHLLTPGRPTFRLEVDFLVR